MTGKKEELVNEKAVNKKEISKFSEFKDECVICCVNPENNNDDELEFIPCKQCKKVIWNACMKEMERTGGYFCPMCRYFR